VQERFDRDRPAGKWHFGAVEQVLQTGHGGFIPAPDGMVKRFRQHRFSTASAPTQRLDGRDRFGERVFCRRRVVILCERGTESDERSCVIGKSLQRAAKPRDGIRWIAGEQMREACAVMRVHRKLRRVELTGTAGNLAIELEQRL
jgi:hypothetical protein